jgi:hypothetical protein
MRTVAVGLDDFLDLEPARPVLIETRSNFDSDSRLHIADTNPRMFRSEDVHVTFLDLLSSGSAIDHHGDTRA